MSDDGELPLVRRSGKSETAFRTISEVAEELDVPQHVLRFWESKFPQVKPLKRGGGRRYYRPEDVALLRRIRDLLYSEGYTIKGVQKLLREGGQKEAPATTAKPETDAVGDAQLPLAGVGEGDQPELNDGEEGATAPSWKPCWTIRPKRRNSHIFQRKPAGNCRPCWPSWNNSVVFCSHGNLGVAGLGAPEYSAPLFRRHPPEAPTEGSSFGNEFPGNGASRPLP
ncbi:MAG: MerR family transcriptional regulator [Magnetospirillum sp.]|nr:MerR family transcriptional regulator [Magnetospirillum sp.]